MPVFMPHLWIDKFAVLNEIYVYSHAQLMPGYLLYAVAFGQPLIEEHLLRRIVPLYIIDYGMLAHKDHVDKQDA